jgi:predicted O-methyltransferase YrrM
MIENFDKITQETLLELEKTQRDFWNISRQTAEFLYNTVINEGFISGIEVGTSNGYSGTWLGKAFKLNCGKLNTIEFYEKRYSIAQANFEKCGVSDVIIINPGEAIEVLKSLPEDLKFDFAFVDANKRESIDYFNLIHPHLKVGGIYTCDNVLSHKEKVQTYLDAINAHPDYRHTILDLPAGLSYARKIR